MADPNPSPLPDELTAFANTTTWDSSFLDVHSPAGQVGASTNNMLQQVLTFEQQIEHATQFPMPESCKRKLHDSPQLLISRPSNGVAIQRTTDVVLYGADGCRRGGDPLRNQIPNPILHLPDRPSNSRSVAVMGLASHTLVDDAQGDFNSAIWLRPRSQQGICSHHTFNSGLNLPDGIMCTRCKGQADVRVSNSLLGNSQLALGHS
jgi:hypothetical protein